MSPAFEGKIFVLRGQFSPVVFHPTWFAKHNLMRTDEAAGAAVEIISQQVTLIKTEWVQLHVTQDRFLASTVDPVFFEPLRDLVVGVIEVLADAIPVSLLGMNHDFHFRIATEEQWHTIGHTLAPKEYWEPLSRGLGLRSLLIEGSREDGLTGFIFGKVEPSRRFDKEKGEYGVYVHINDHIEVSAEKEPPVPESARRAAEIIVYHWDASVKRAQEVAKSIVSIAGQEGTS